MTPDRHWRGPARLAEKWPPLHWYCLLAWSVVAIHLLDLNRLHPDLHLPAYLAEDGPFQNLQLLLLGWALGLGALGLWRFREDRRRVLVFLFGPLFYLFWREADWDKDHLSALLGSREEVRMFSWRYLWSGPEIPVLLKVIWVTVSLGLVAAWLGACWRARAAWPALVQLMKTPPVRFWLGLTLGCLALSPALERLGLVPHAPGVKDPYWEEAPELLGEVALVSFMILLFEHIRRESPRPEHGVGRFEKPARPEPLPTAAGLTVTCSPPRPSRYRRARFAPAREHPRPG